MNKKRIALKIIKTLNENGHEAYFVGGCVRDLLLKKKPKDFDIATDAVPKRIETLFKRTVAIGAQFGVMLVILDGESFEVSTFRADKGYQDGRHPTGVRFTNAKEDAFRRDFTVNGLFYDPLEKKVYDWVDGRRDLKRRVIRAIGNPGKRFDEDKLRMLRAIRFASALGFGIESKTLTALKKRVGRISTVSKERVRDELIKMFTGPNPLPALVLLEKTGLLKEVLPEVQKMRGVGQPRDFHPEGDVLTHTGLLLKRLRNPSIVLAFSCLLHDVGKPRTYRRTDRIRFYNHEYAGAKIADQILTDLRFSNDLKKKIVACIENHMRFKDVQKMKESTLKKFMQRETFEDELEQHRVDCLASHGDLKNWRFLKKKKRDYSPEQIKPEPLINGHDLIRLGFSEGPAIGNTLKLIEELQLEGKLSTHNEAINFIKSNKKSLSASL